MTRRYPERPLIGVGGIVLTPTLDRVLLIRRAAPPAQGLWSIPGGLVQAGEPLEQACQRELQEETGLVVAVTRSQVARLVERIIPDTTGAVEYHYLIVDFWTIDATGTEPVAASDASDVVWASPHELHRWPTTHGLTGAIQRALCLARGEVPTTPLLETIVGV